MTGLLEEGLVLGELTFDFDSNRHIIAKLPHKDVFKDMFYGVDFGWTNPSCLLAIGVDGDGRCYVVEEFYKSKVSKENLVKVATQMRDRWGEGTFYCDRSEPECIEKFVDAGLDAVANKVGREDGLMDVGGRFLDAGDGKPRIFVYSGCINLIRELQVYVENKKVNDHS